jgi:hypothetical protein
MAQDQFNVTINDETLSKIVQNMLVDTLPDKNLMIDYLTRLIMKGDNGANFFMALTNTFPDILFKPGDKVRIRRKTLWYNIDDKQTEEVGYIEGDGIYVYIKEINHVNSNCYQGVVTYIDPAGNTESRETSFNNDVILMDNTIKISAPNILPGDLI